MVCRLVLRKLLAMRTLPKRCGEEAEYAGLPVQQAACLAELAQTQVLPAQDRQAATRHSSLDLATNVYTDPTLFDMAGAVEALPDLSLGGRARSLANVAVTEQPGHHWWTGGNGLVRLLRATHLRPAPRGRPLDW